MLDAVRKLPEAEDPLFVARVLLDSISRKTLILMRLWVMDLM